MDAPCAVLAAALRRLLTDVVPHVRDTGHNAADREMNEAIRFARHALVEHENSKTCKE